MGLEQNDGPVDHFISRYFQQHRSLGSKDRAFIAESVYTYIRWQRLIEYLCPEHNLQKKINFLKEFDPQQYLQDPNIPPAIRLSFPEILYTLLSNHYGPEKTQEICLACNTQAPTTVRVNRAKISREQLLDKWLAEGYQVKAAEHSNDAIQFIKKIALFSLPEFKQGLFEMQDEASQLAAGLLKVQPGEWVLDYCAGSGGKTLAFAPAMQNKGQIFLHDIRPWILTEAKKRLRRAGIQNAQILLPDDEKKRQSLKKKMDWVLVDAPCSGTGTLRRNPDMKWKFSEEQLQRLIGQQRTIFEKALSFLKPAGKIVYATCSILTEENEQQIAHFCKTYGLEVENAPFATLPTKDGMDGFFATVLKKRLSS